MNKERGILVTLSAPGGTGKGTIISKYLEKNKDIILSISYTSRAKRPGDPEGSYHFISKDEFEEMIKNDEFFEWVEFCGSYYGTSKKFILDKINENKNVILEIDYSGALRVKKILPEAILAFVLPPDFEELKTRLKNRCSDSDARVSERLKKGIEEVENAHKFDYLIINDKLDDAVEDLNEIIKNESLGKKVDNLKIDNNINKDFIDNFLLQIQQEQK